jgi:serine/threonine protein kinase
VPRDEAHQGETLAELLKRGAERVRLVAAFEHICQAVAYAHSYAFILRDLNSANVMVGAFGEILVMDYGLCGPTRGS